MSLHLSDAVGGYQTSDVGYLNVEGRTFMATVYQPNGPGPFPALLVVHGGAWTHEGIDRANDLPIDRYLAARGMVVVAIDFRQDGEHHFPASIADVNFAMRWLRANAYTFQASPRMIGALGSSSGGHLVMLNAMKPNDVRWAYIPVSGQPATAASPDYVVLQSPILDPVARRQFAEETGRADLVAATDAYFVPPSTLQDADPQLMLDRHERLTLPPALIIQGTADLNVDFRQQERFATAYRAAGGHVELDEFQGATHVFMDAAPGPDAVRALRAVGDFIARQLTKAA